eukprot:CAMPEP_0183812404 /NCGR_PEP_ID=MMETSP0803_2-20130417/51161_1 /TAXON_ID=195967 /ORGANISM="Crustomastix stigmata, Strain CCMP3273" /LENGTH=194 /DNA_ID=CAMNT_0026057243 /DNA_START=16 /DNA_END=595 /DNA_ORIENTATION=+
MTTATRSNSALTFFCVLALTLEVLRAHLPGHPAALLLAHLPPPVAVREVRLAPHQEDAELAFLPRLPVLPQHLLDPPPRPRQRRLAGEVEGHYARPRAAVVRLAQRAELLLARGVPYVQREGQAVHVVALPHEVHAYGGLVVLREEVLAVAHHQARLAGVLVAHQHALLRQRRAAREAGAEGKRLVDHPLEAPG